MITLRPLQTGMYCMAEKKYCCLARIEGDVIFAPDQHRIYEIIDSPPPPERDWSDVVSMLVKLGDSCCHGERFDRAYFADYSRKILQQADKPAPVKKITKKWVNISKGIGGVTFNTYDTREMADMNASKDRINHSENRIACKEIEIEYTEGEGLDG